MNAWNRALFTHFLLAIAAALLSYCSILLNGSGLVLTTYFIFFASLFLYRLAYYGLPLTLKKISLSDKILLPLSLLGMMVFFPPHYELLVLSGVSFVACLAYFLTIGNWKGLRSVTMVKSMWLALVWSVVTVWLPLFNGDATEVFKIFAERFTFMLPVCIIYNLRDWEHDYISGINTVPHRVGVVFTKLICIALLLCCYALISINNYPTDIYNALVVSLALTGLIVLCARKNGAWWYYTLLVDGSMIMQSMLVIFAVQKPVH